MKSLIRPLLSGLLLILTALGLMNVYSDNSEVVKMAEAAACNGCELRAVAVGRSPIEQTFSFQVGQSTRVVAVRCQRSFILVGSYVCSAQPL